MGLVHDTIIKTGHPKVRTNMRRIAILLITAFFLQLLTGCSPKEHVMDGGGMVKSYSQISQEEAKQMMKKDDGHVIVDVRRQDEYDAGRPAELPDLDQIIMIYCRSGNRSKQAAQKLFDMGYTRIYEFGGIIDWTGEIVTEENEPMADKAGGIWTRTDMPSHLRYDRMWEYSAHAETDDPEQIAAIVDTIKGITVEDPVDYAVEDYTDILTFSFDDGTTMRLEFEEYNWVKDGKERYHVEGLGALRNLLEDLMDGDERVLEAD